MRTLPHSLVALTFLLLGAGLPAAGDQIPASPATLSERAFARALLQELIEINTAPANGCTRATEAMAARLRAAGFSDSEVLIGGPRPEKQNLVVRWRGRGQAKPILLIAHLDVVDAPREGWMPGLDPFQLTERDGFFYGRGVLDVKNAVAGLVAGLIRLRTEGFVPSRDIIVALTADEETGPANGVSWLLANRREWVDAAYCLNLDAGGGQIVKGKRARLTVQTSQKTNASFRAETRSPGGHSSLPGKDNAIYRLSAGLARLAEHDLPFRFNETTRAYFERVSAAEDGQTAADMLAVAKNPPDLAAAKRLASASPYHNSLLHTTCVATRIEGGSADNALPQSARAVINCRIFPGDTVEWVRAWLVQTLADPEIIVTRAGGGPESPASPMLPEVMGSIERVSQEMWPGMTVLPVMDPWAGDSAQVRRAGIPTFGVSGVFSDDSGNEHGANERISVAAFYDSTEYIYRLMKVLSANAASLYAAGSPIVSTGTARMQNCSAIKLTVNESGTKLSGKIIFHINVAADPEPAEPGRITTRGARALYCPREAPDLPDMTN
jgi:acetylornithine deacetylase/succinyl-diaminopimelate desuccinylase-like protein